MEAGQQRSELSRFTRKHLQKCGTQEHANYPKTVYDQSHVDRENKSSEIFHSPKKNKGRLFLIFRHFRIYSIFLGLDDAFISIGSVRRSKIILQAGDSRCISSVFARDNYSGYNEK